MQQFLAIGTYSDGSTGDITTSVDLGQQRRRGSPASARPAVGQPRPGAAGPVTISAAAAGISGSARPQVGPPVLLAIVVSPANPAITAGNRPSSSPPTGVLSDGTTRDLTATASWSSQNYATATSAARGIANGRAAGHGHGHHRGAGRGQRRPPASRSRPRPPCRRSR